LSLFASCMGHSIPSPSFSLGLGIMWTWVRLENHIYTLILVLAMLTVNVVNLLVSDPAIVL
jgi:hypothetical protein